MVKKAVQRGRSKRGGEAYSVRYVEPPSAARTKLADFFNILLSLAPIPLRRQGGRTLGPGTPIQGQRLCHIRIMMVKPRCNAKLLKPPIAKRETVGNFFKGLCENSLAPVGRPACAKPLSAFVATSAKEARRRLGVGVRGIF